MRQYITFALVATLIATVTAYPNVDTAATLEEAILEESVRVKRFTCDFLSYKQWNHTPCTTHCYALNRSGGYCNEQGVCVCRKGKIFNSPTMRPTMEPTMAPNGVLGRDFSYI